MVTHQNERQISSNSSEKDDISPNLYEDAVYRQRLPERCDPWAFHPPTTNWYTYGSPIFKAVQKKQYKALYREPTRSPISPEDAVGVGSKWCCVDRSVGTL